MITTLPYYYKLKQEWSLRGWEGVPHALVNSNTGQLAVLSNTAFFVASACDGETNFDSPIFFEKHIHTRDQFLAADIIEKTESPTPISEYQKYHQFPNPFYKTLHWSITGSCNLKCRHCYLCASEKKYNDLTFSQITKLIDEINEAGIMEVSITGGEPFVRKDVWDILELIIEKGIKISQIYTNGLLVSNSVLARLKKLEAFQKKAITFCLSFDGVGTHDDIRGINGTELKTIKAIQRIVDHGFPVRIETVLYKKNANNLNQTLDLLNKQGVQYWKVSAIGDSGKWLETGGAENLSIKEVFDCYLDVLKHFICIGRPLNIQLGNLYSGGKDWHGNYNVCDKNTSKNDENFLEQYSCNCSRYIRYLLSDGTLLPCISMTGSEIHKNMPNVQSKCLSEALKDRNLWEIVSVKVSDLAKKNKECSDCEYLGNCSIGCRSCALTYNKSVFAKDPFTCFFWKNKYPEKVAQLIQQK